MSHCPSVEQLELLLVEQLSELDRDTVVAHVEDCTTCKERLAKLVRQTDSVVMPVPQEKLDSAELETFLFQLKQIPAPRILVSAPGASVPNAVAERPPSDASPVAEPAGCRPLQRLGQYEILERLGRGGMGVVYRARHVELGKIVALKVLRSEWIDEVSVARFKNEIRAIGALDHPNIIGTHDAGEIDGVHFLVMAFAEGTDLARLLARHGRLSVPDACEAIRQAATGLQHAFDRGLVHRDVKPSNLLLARDGLVKVLDLGIARFFAHEPAVKPLTATGMFLGTADYLAPEQWDNPRAVDARADVYSLGCTLYQLVAGRAPFSGDQYDTVLKKMRAHQETPAPAVTDARPEVPAALAAVLARMLAKDLRERPPTPGDVARALAPFAAGSDLAKLLDQDAPVIATEAALTPTIAIPPASETPGGAQRESTCGDIASGKGRPAPSGPAPSHAVRTSQGDGRPARSRRARRVPLAILAGVSLTLAVATTYLFWRGFSRPLPATDPPTILSMNVSQYRGTSADLLGDVGATTEVMRVDDTLRVSVKLSAPAYCYLIAFNPDGTEQLCYPEDPDVPAVSYPEHKNAPAMNTPPKKVAELRYPREQYFEPGVAGLQTFVVIASADPLPPYARWRAGVGQIPWKPAAYDQPWRWYFDGQEFVRLPNERGRRVERGAPEEFKKLCGFFQSQTRPGVVQALAFPVTKE